MAQLQIHPCRRQGAHQVGGGGVGLRSLSTTAQPRWRNRRAAAAPDLPKPITWAWGMAGLLLNNGAKVR
jgi:hypothetical protein